MKEEKIRLEDLIKKDRNEFEDIRKELSGKKLEEEDRERFDKLVEEYEGLINGPKSRSIVKGSHSKRLAKMKELIRQLRENLARLEEVEGLLEDLSQNNRDEREFYFGFPYPNGNELYIEFIGDESSDSYRLEAIGCDRNKEVYEDLEVVDYHNGYRDMRALVIDDLDLLYAILDDLTGAVKNTRLNLYDSKNNFIELGKHYGSPDSMDEDYFENFGDEPILDVMSTKLKSLEYNKLAVTIVAMNISPDAELGARLRNEAGELIAESHKIIDSYEQEIDGRKEYYFDIGLELDEAHIIEGEDYYISALIDGKEYKIIDYSYIESPVRASIVFHDKYMFTEISHKDPYSKYYGEIIIEGCNILDNGPYSVLITDKEFNINKEYKDLEAVKNPAYHRVGLEIDLSDLRIDDEAAQELYYVIIDRNGDIKEQFILG